mgnify:CR=1 FL=1
MDSVMHLHIPNHKMHMRLICAQRWLPKVSVSRGGPVGWAMATHVRTELVLQALNMALLRNRPKHGVVDRRIRGQRWFAFNVGIEVRSDVPEVFSNAHARVTQPRRGNRSL